MHIAVVGTGLIGTSLGLAWRARGHLVVGCDVDERALEAARTRGAFDRTVDFDSARSADALVLAVPLDAACALLARLRDGSGNPAVVFDVASLQQPVIRAAAGLPGFVATHPMAGREGSGAAAADGAIFAGQPWIYEPVGGEPESVVVRLIVETGAIPVPLDGATHDRAVAVTSHLPQLLALALARCVGRRAAEGGVRAVAGPGLRGALRLANARWSMWGPLLAEQGHRDADLLEDLAAELKAMAAALRNGDPATIRRAFDEGPELLANIFRNTKDRDEGQDS